MGEQNENPKHFVIYRGTRIIEAQSITHYDVNGEDFERVRYGNESDDWGAYERPCHDCGGIKGEYHVPSCDVERCPKCGGQAISCDCLDEVDERTACR
jgi:hypothetical protein